MEIPKVPPGPPPGAQQPGGETQTVNKALAQFAFAQLDADKNGELSKEEAAKIPGLAKLFEQLDKNGDGVIDAEEIAAAMGGSAGEAPSPGQGGPAPTEGQGQEGKGEGEGGAKGKGQGQGKGNSPGGPTSNPLDAAISQFVFQLLDVNKDGKVSKEEAAKIPQLAQSFEKLDADGDGGLNPGELNGQKAEDTQAAE